MNYHINGSFNISQVFNYIEESAYANTPDNVSIVFTYAEKIKNLNYDFNNTFKNMERYEEPHFVMFKVLNFMLLN